MGKELFFVRHSEAREAYRGQADADRGLTESGSIRAMQLGNYLKEQGVRPDALFSSEALRARQTAELLGENILEAGKEIRYHPDLYESSVRLMLAFINTLDDRWGGVMIVGHNPILPYTVEYLTGTIVDTLEPGGMLHVTTEGDAWEEISGKTMDMQAYLSPAVYAL